MTTTEAPQEPTKTKLRERLSARSKVTTSFVVESVKKAAKKIADSAKNLWHSVIRPPLDVVVAAVFGSAIGRTLSFVYFTIVSATAGAWVLASIFAVMALWEAWLFANVSPYLAKILAFEVEVARVNDDRKRNSAFATATA